MKKILLVGDSPLSDSPYIRSYIEVFEQNAIPYELLFWNRHLDSTKDLPTNHIPYNRFTDNNFPFWRRLLNIWRFARFVSKRLHENDYACVVVFTIAHAVFMNRSLKKRYKKRYVFDIRDYSPLCKIGLFCRIVNRLVENSAFTVVSSAGFLRWLPYGERFNYLVAHNTTKGMIEKYFDYKETSSESSICNVVSILTIGQLRDFSANCVLMDKLKNNPHFKLVYSGSGLASEPLKNYAVQNHIENAIFTGRYQKSDEESIVMKHQMLNAYLPRNINSDTLMSNRFYLSVLMRKPLIANKGSFQAELCEKYDFGVVLDENDDFADKIKSWWRRFDAEKYNRACKIFLECVKCDMKRFEQKMVESYDINKNRNKQQSEGNPLF